MRQYTECLSYTPTPSGNLINSGTRWNIEGSLIRQIEVEEKEISCSNRSEEDWGGLQAEMFVAGLSWCQ